MDEETTTVSENQDTGAQEAQPVNTDDTSTAADATTEPSESTEDANQEDSTESTEASASEPDDKLKKYAASQGLELDSPSAIKAVRIAMKAQSEATRNHQRASELEKATVAISDQDAQARAEQTGQDPELLKRLQAVEVKETVRDFWNQDGIDKAYEPAMIEIVQAKPYLAGDLEALYATAVMKSGGVAAVKSQGKREALESLAHKQQAAVPTGNATTTGTPKKKDFKDLSIAEMEKQLGFVRQ